MDTGNALVYRIGYEQFGGQRFSWCNERGPVFPGTRVPVQTLIEYLEAGDSIDEFLTGFPSVSRSQVIAFLERATTLAVTDAA